MPIRDTKVPHPDDNVSHRGEYEGLRDEIKLYQQEMHRTWLWAIIPAGVVYAWLASPVPAGAVYTWIEKSKSKDSTPFPPEVWFIPVVFVLLCGIRYLVFSCRINQLAEYQCDLEEDAFGKKGKLRGIAARNRQSHLPVMFVIGACLVWGALLGCATYVSCEACKMKPRPYILGASVVWLALAAYPIHLSWKLWRMKPSDSDSPPSVGPPAPASPLAPIQLAPSPLATPPVSPSPASPPTNSQPTHKP